MKFVSSIFFGLCVCLGLFAGNERGGGGNPEELSVYAVKQMLFNRLSSTEGFSPCRSAEGKDLNAEQESFCELINEIVHSEKIGILENHPSAQFDNVQNLRLFIDSRAHVEFRGWVLEQPKKLGTLPSGESLYEVSVSYEISAKGVGQSVFLNLVIHWDGQKSIY